MKKLIEELKDDIIIITKNKFSKKILNYLSKNKILLNINFYTKEEFILELKHSYTNDVYIYLNEKYHINYNNIDIYLENIYYIDENRNYNIKSLDYLVTLKKELINNGYIKYNHMFKTFLKKKNIIIYGYDYLDSHFYTCINKYKYKHIKDDFNYKKSISIYSFKDIYEETMAVCERICILLKDGIDINKIKIHISTERHRKELIKYLNLFDINHNIYLKDSLYNYNIINRLFELIDNKYDIDILLENLRKCIKTDTDMDIYNKIISIINKYGIKDLYKYKELLKYEFKNISLDKPKYTNSINEIDVLNDLVEDEHIFLVGFNHSVIPIIKTDDDYIKDCYKTEVVLDDSYKINEYLKSSWIEKINSISNLYISYINKDGDKDLFVSGLIKDLETNSKINIISNYKFLFNSIKINKLLLGDLLDNLHKYNTFSDRIPFLLKNTKNFYYDTYNNKYKNDTPVNFTNYNISYTGIDTFYKCQFRYLLTYILRIDDRDNSIKIFIGNVLHKILYEVIKNETDEYDEIIEEILSLPNSLDIITNNKLYYIKRKIKKHIKDIINTIKIQDIRKDFYDTYFEYEVEYKYNDEFSLKGVIDKICTYDYNDVEYFVIIDYKLGDKKYDFNNVIYGLDMQPLYYYYLISKNNDSNIKLAGLYTQRIGSKKFLESNNTLNNELFDLCKLQGYTIDNSDIVNKIDNKIEEGSYIKGIKILKDSSFQKSQYLLSTFQFESLIDIIDKNIGNMITLLNESDFKINPKTIGSFNNNVSCKHCNYFDICYKGNHNYVNNVNYKDLSFINN